MAAPTIPPQSAPPLLTGKPGDDPSTRLFNKAWWLFFNSLGGGGSSAEGYNEVTVDSGGHVTPNLSKGLIQYVRLTQDAVLDPPLGGGPATWTLIVDEDPTGNWTLSPDPATYFHSITVISGPSTRNQIRWFTDRVGNTSLSGAPSMGQPIPS